MDPRELEALYRRLDAHHRDIEDLKVLDRRVNTVIDHDHTATPGDGGILTNDEHDGYSEYVEIAKPAAPAANKARFYAVDNGAGVTYMAYKRSDDTEVLLGEGAPTDAPYVVEAADGDLSDGRVLGTTVIPTSTFAARPAAASAGRLHFPSDGWVIGRDTGAAWEHWGPIWKLTPPALADFAWVNQGTATATEGGGGIFLENSGTGYNLRMLVQADPATPWTITAAFLPRFLTESDQQVGLCFRRSANGYVITYHLRPNSNALVTGAIKWTDPATINSSYYTADGFIYYLAAGLVWMRLYDDGTNRRLYLSTDGYNWILKHTALRSDFADCDQVGFFVGQGAAASYEAMTLLHWSVA